MKKLNKDLIRRPISLLLCVLMIAGLFGVAMAADDVAEAPVPAEAIAPVAAVTADADGPAFATGSRTVQRTEFYQCRNNGIVWTMPLYDWHIAPEGSVSFAPWRVAGVGPNAASTLYNNPYARANWVPAAVPGTVAGALIDAGKYDDIFVPDAFGEIQPFFDANQQRIPRMDFSDWWWHSIDFDLTAAQAGTEINLNLRQISYVGEVFVNGVQVFNENTTIQHVDELKNRVGASIDLDDFIDPVTGAWRVTPRNAPDGVGNQHGEGLPGHLPSWVGEHFNQATDMIVGPMFPTRNPDWGMSEGSNPQPPFTFTTIDMPGNPTRQGAVNSEHVSNSSAFVHPEEFATPEAFEAFLRDPQAQFERFSREFMGTYRIYDVDIGHLLNAGRNNIMIRVSAMHNLLDFGPFWHDWHPAAPDNNMGLNGRITLTGSGPVRTANPVAVATVDRNHNWADMEFYIELTNMTDEDYTVRVEAIIQRPDGSVLQALQSRLPVTIPAGAYNWEVAVHGDAPFRILNPELWWPFLSGDQPLYTIEYTIFSGPDNIDEEVSDLMTHRFAIRQIYHEVNKFSDHPQSYLSQTYVNHRPIMMQGGGFSATDMYYRHSTLDLYNLIDILQSLGHNFVRDEGKFFSEELLDLYDEYGFLNMTGYMCCDRNEDGANGWSLAERFIAFESTYSQMRSVRAHANAYVWLNGSDYAKDNDGKNNAFAWTDMEDLQRTIGSNSFSGFNIHRKMMEIGGRMRWYDIGIVMSHASGPNAWQRRWSSIIGSTDGMGMDHGYHSFPPAKFWTDVPLDPFAPGAPTNLMGQSLATQGTATPNDTGDSNRGAWAFISEGAGGAAVPVRETLLRMIPEDNLWPYNLGHQGGDRASGDLDRYGNLINPAADIGPGNYNMWNYHAASAGVFATINCKNNAIDQTYGPSRNIDEYLIRAQLFQFDHQRAVHEALNVRRFRYASGFVNWMLNGPRPTIYWNQFDFYFNPHGGTFGTGRGNLPLHIMMDPYQSNIYVSNRTLDDHGTLTAEVRIFDIYGNRIDDGSLLEDVRMRPDGIAFYEYSLGVRDPEDPDAGVTILPSNAPRSAFEDYVEDRVVGFRPTVRNRMSGDGYDDWFRSAFTPVYVQYSVGSAHQQPGGGWGVSRLPANQRGAWEALRGGRRAAANTDTHTGLPGLTHMWNAEDLENALILPTTDVYFVSLELVDEDDNLVTRNDYALSRRMDSLTGQTVWNSAEIAQYMDLTQLNQLPYVDLEITRHAGALCPDSNRGHWVQEVTIYNPTDYVAYGIELQSFNHGDAATRRMVPVIYCDNLFTLFPGESRTITVRFLTGRHSAGDVYVAVDLYNNVIQRTNEALGVASERTGNVYYPADPLTDRWPFGTYDDGVFVPQHTLTSQTTNLSRAAYSHVGPLDFDASAGLPGITAITGINTANTGAVRNHMMFANERSRTVLESNTQASLDVLPGQAAFVDLGSVQTFDRIMVRWNHSTLLTTALAQLILSGAPNVVDVYVSVTGAPDSWELVVDEFDNTLGRSVMTNLLLDEAVTAQFIRVVPSGLTTGSSDYGRANNTGTPEIDSNWHAGGNRWITGGRLNDFSPVRPAPAAFRISAIEVFNTYNYIAVEVDEGVRVTVRGEDRDIDSDSSPWDRLVKIHAGTPVELEIDMPADSDMRVVLNGVDMTDDLVDGILTIEEAGDVFGHDLLQVGYIELDELSRQAFMVGTPEGVVNPGGSMTRAGVATILFRLITDEMRYDYWEQDNPFPDVVLESWFNNAVSTMTNAEIFTGFPDGTFAPNQTITRAELAVAVVRFMDASDEVVPGATFTDIGGHWAANYISIAAANGWIQGPEGPTGPFNPNLPITRAETATLINQAFGRLVYSVNDLHEDMLTWPDNANEGAWYFTHIQSATNSYTFEWRDDGVFEIWLSIIDPREWWRLERPDSTPNSIFDVD